MREYLTRSPATAREIQAQIGLSPAAVARQLREMGGGVIKLPNGRAPRYALTKNAFGGNDNLPLSMTDEGGNTVVIGQLRPLAHGGFFVELAPGASPLLAGEGGNGLYDDLPYFLFDLSPQGFLGRQIAKELAALDDSFPADPRRWNTNHIGRYLLANGDDLSGNIALGEPARLRLRRPPIPTSEKDYPALADRVMNGVIPGSSAGGEQPKFTTFCGARLAHVIVKFSPKGDNDLARRWRDILISEHHAAETLRSLCHLPAADTRLIAMDDRIFLESQRFDRSGEYGRLSMISLRSIDAEFTGVGGGFSQVMKALHHKGLVSWQHVLDAKLLYTFGMLTNNTDMHLGNMSLALEGNVFRLLPTYDMCAMGFAPRSGGEVPPYRFVPPAYHAGDLACEVLPTAQNMAHAFWERLGKDERISPELRDFIRQGNPIERMGK